MSEVVFNGLRILQAVLFIIVAIASFTFWRRTRFWLPKYAHLLAGIGGAVGLWCLASGPADAAVRKQGPIANLLFVLLLPAIIYLLFVLYGGQRAAYERRFGTPGSCPHCKLPVPACNNPHSKPDGEVSDRERRCPHCGQTFASQVPCRD
jgi:hypothetical protein